MTLDFPQPSDWRNLQKTYPFEKLEITEDHFRYTIHPPGSLERFSAVPNIQAWIVHLKNRLIQTRWSYVFLMFHFAKGIPDDEWYISPGKKGESVQYYPHFEEKHYFAKAQFDYYSDIFYYKLFSAWDTLGQILNVMYELEIDRPDFYKAVNSLQHLKPTLYANLKGIIDSDDFRAMRQMRHNITHNYLPGHVTSGIHRVSANEVTLGVGSYTPSSQVKNNVVASLDSFALTLEAIKTQSLLDSAP